jgi:RHS repeat-associated protein
MTAAVGARNLFKVDAGVVHALMQARYQNSSRGQFISEDSVFLGDPKQQVLIDPQTLNSYSYANDNPITKSDPTGKCIEDGCAVEALASVGFVAGVTGQYIGDVMENHSNGVTGLAAYQPRSSAAQYLTAGVAGSAGTVAAAYSLAAGAVISAGGYAADRQLGGKPLSLGGTLSVGGLSLIGGNFFEWGVGKGTASLWFKKLISGTAFAKYLVRECFRAGEFENFHSRSTELDNDTVREITTDAVNRLDRLLGAVLANGEIFFLIAGAEVFDLA